MKNEKSLRGESVNFFHLFCLRDRSFFCEVRGLVGFGEGDIPKNMASKGRGSRKSTVCKGGSPKKCL